jgi:hypothetical protein
MAEERSTTAPRAWLVAAVVVVLGVGFVAARSWRGAPGPGLTADAGASADDATSASARVCPLLRDAPAEPPPPLAPLDAGECQVIGLVRSALTKADLPDPELTALRAAVERAMLEEPAACVPAFARELAGAKDCGLAYDAVAIRLLTSRTSDPLVSARELARPAKCQWKLIAALREAPRVDVPVAAALLRLTRAESEDVRGSAWLALGTLERIARGAAQPEVVGCIDPLLAAALAEAKGEALANLVSAAGNAGCEACRPTLSAIAGGADARLRRSAVTALRFSTHADDVETLCRVARTDREQATRAAAAFALRFEHALPDVRAKCLFEAATEDGASPVRHDAVLSLAELAEKDTLFVGVLLHVVARARDDVTRGQAVEALRAFATDEAIQDALRDAVDD